MNSVMSHLFSQVPKAEIERSSFDRSHGCKTTFDSGWLIPVYWDEVLPGDTFNMNMSFFCRLATPWKPVMDNIFLDSFFFFVPNRLLWTNWVKMMGEQDNPGDSVSFSVPQMPSPTTPGIVSGSLADHFGLPVGLASSFNFNSLHFRAYNQIFNKWFKDENLDNNLQVDVGDGPDTYANYSLAKRRKRHDYFTSCLPWPQKNVAGSVTVPLGSTAPVKTNASDLVTGIQPALRGLVSSSGGALGTGAYLMTNADGHTISYATTGPTRSGDMYPSNLFADLTGSALVTINTFRQAFQVQKLYERDARGGTRYTEIVRAHFGVISPDARLQRPEYLGGGRSYINMNPVAQTTAQSSPTAKDGQGNLAAFATGSGTGHGFTKSFTEHGVLIGLVCVTADLTYQQGLNKAWTRRTRMDYYWPALSHIGEQAVLNQEIYCDGSGSGGADGQVFGYQERYAEYRYKPSEIRGLFRSNVSSGNTTIDYWHLSQNFGSLPALNSTFMAEAPPINRVVQVTSQPQFLFDAYFKLLCARAMPVYGVPGMVDRF